MRSSRVDAIPIRVLGGISAAGATLMIALGLVNWLRPHPGRDLRVMIPIGLYFLSGSVGTLLLRRIGALMIVIPCALAGLAGVFDSLRDGNATAVILNIFVSVPIMCLPAVTVTRHWRLLR